MKTVRDDYGAYRSRKYRSKKKRVRCPFCRETMKFSVYANHCATEHSIDAKEKCIYCGKKLPFRTEKENASHLKMCLEKFFMIRPAVMVEKEEEPMAIPSPDPVENPCETCMEDVRNDDRRRPDWSGEALKSMGSMYDRSETRTRSVPEFVRVESAEELVRKRDSGKLSAELVRTLSNDLRFADENTESARLWLYRFVRHRGTGVRFYHAMIRAATFGRFEKLLAEEDVYVLPFACMCDGSSKEWDAASTVSREDKMLYVFHKHMIIVARRGAEFVRRVTLAMQNFRPKCFERKDKRYWLKTIHDASYFVNVMVYVSRPGGHCAGFELKRDPANEIPVKTKRQSHHRIETPLGPHASWHLSITVPGLLEEQVRFRHWNVGPYRDKKKVNKSWYAPLRELRVNNCAVRFAGGRILVAGDVGNATGYVYFLNDRVVGLSDGRVVDEMLWDDPVEYSRWCVETKNNLLLNIFGDDGILFKMRNGQQRETNRWSKQMDDLKAKLTESQTENETLKFKNCEKDCKLEKFGVLMNEVFTDSDISIPKRRSLESTYRKILDPNDSYIEEILELKYHLTDDYTATHEATVKTHII